MISVDDLERLILRDQLTTTVLSECRSLIAKILASEMGLTSDSPNFEEMVADLEIAPYQRPDAAIVIVRCLSIPKLIISRGENNQLQRAVVSICERLIPDLCDFVHLNEKKQTFEKIMALVRIIPYQSCIRRLGRMPREIGSRYSLE